MKLYSDLISLKRFLKQFGFKPLYFIIPALISLGAALFEGAQAGLLIPFIKGVMAMNFSFIHDLPVFKNILAILPTEFKTSDVCLFALVLGFIFFAAVMKEVCTYLGSITVLYQVRKISNNMRKLVFKRYLTFGKLFYDRSTVGHLNEILMGFTAQISGQLAGLHAILNSSFMLIIYFFIMFAISWKLTLLVMLAFPVLNYSLKWLIEKIQKTAQYFSDARLAIGKRIFNVLSCILLVKSYSREKEEEDHFVSNSDLVAQLEFSMDKKRCLVHPIQEIVFLIMLFLLVTVMAFLVIKDQSGSISALLVYFFVLKRSGTAFRVFNDAKVSLASISGFLEGLTKVFDDQDKYFEIEGRKEFDGLKNGIHFNHLTFSYPNGLTALKNVSFKIEKGKMTAVVGASGAGKTTLINLILRFYNSLPASIMIDGVDIREFTLKSLRAKTVLVSQETLLFNDTLRGNMTYGHNGTVTDEKLIDAVKRARLYDFVMQLPHHFETEIGDRGVKLSGGEKQRVSIARAILKEPEILILDEATSSLDSTTERLIQESIEELVKGRTSIVIAHRLSTIKNADKIIVIENGSLFEEGTLAALLTKKGKFHEYWEEQKFY